MEKTRRPRKIQVSWPPKRGKRKESSLYVIHHAQIKFIRTNEYHSHFLFHSLHSLLPLSLNCFKLDTRNVLGPSEQIPEPAAQNPSEFSVFQSSLVPAPDEPIESHDTRPQHKRLIFPPKRTREPQTQLLPQQNNDAAPTG